MPTITVMRHDLEGLLGRKVSLKELDEMLPLLKAELDSKTKSEEVIQDNKGVWSESTENFALRIELNDTNRPDTWTCEGIARQLKDHENQIDKPRDYPFYANEPTDLRIEVDPALEKIRPYVGGFVVKGGPIDDDGLVAFIEVQEVLTRNFGKKRKTVSIGIYNAAEISFPVKYHAVDRHSMKFTPLAPVQSAEEAEAAPWVSREMTPAEILELHPTGREYAGILEGLELVPMLSDQKGAVLSFPPVINSSKIGRVQPGMNHLFVEVTGTSLNQCQLALNIMAANFADRGWSVEPATAQYPFDTELGREVCSPYKMEQSQPVTVEEVRKLLGVDLTVEQTASLLRKFGVRTSVDSNSQLTATIPSYRADYLHPVDVIEDIAISRGYDSFEPKMPAEFTIGKLDPLTQLEDRIRDRMVGYGFEEVICNILTGEPNVREDMNLSGDLSSMEPFYAERLVKISNIMNLRYAVLRDSLLPSLLTVAGKSTGAEYPHQCFEVGEVAVYDPDQNLGSRTESRLAGLIADENASLDSVQQIIYALLGNLRIEFEVHAWEHPSFIPGRCGVVLASGQKLAFFGEIAPTVLNNFKARSSIAAFELKVNTIAQLLNI